MEPSSPRRFFDAIARRYDRVYAPDGVASRAKMARVLAALPTAARVLDLGVGTGRELGALQDAGHAPVGFDISGEMLALCARRARPVPLVEGDFWQALAFDDGAFDAVVALHGTLAHPPDEGALGALAERIARVLRPGGVFVAELPLPAWLEAADACAAPSGVRVRRLDQDRCVHEDCVAQVAIEALVLPPERWERLLAPWFRTRTQRLGEAEFLVIGARRSVGAPFAADAGG